MLKENEGEAYDQDLALLFAGKPHSLDLCMPLCNRTFSFSITRHQKCRQDYRRSSYAVPKESDHSDS